MADGPLVRVNLYDLGAAGFGCLLAVHHLVIDGTSLAVFMEEFGAVYAALSEGRAPSLPSLAITPGDIAVWQRARLEEADLQADEDYWRTSLAPPLPVLGSLRDVTDDVPAGVQGPPGALVTTVLGSDALTRLRTFAAANGTSPFAVMFALWSAVLMRHARTHDICHGVPVDDRPRPEADRLIGCFIKTLPIRVRIDEAASFSDMLAAVQAAWDGAQRHADLPLRQILAAAGLRTAPFRSVFAYQQWDAGDDAAFRRWDLDLGRAAFDLVLDVIETPAGASIRLEFARSFSDEATARRLLDRLVAAADELLAMPDQPLSRASFLAAAERATLAKLNTTVGALNSDATLHGLFAASAQRVPDAVALVHGEITLTYKELDRRVDTFARALVAADGGPHRRIAILVGRGIDMVVAILATLRAGSAYIPIDDGYPPARIRDILADGDPALVVATADTLALVPPAVRERVVDIATPRPVPDDLPLPQVAPADIAYVIFTSGTTGRPKGVEVAHRGVVNYAGILGELLALSPGTRMLQFAATGFDAAAAEIFSTLAAGATLVLADKLDILPGRDLEETILRHRIDVVTLPPSVLALVDPARLAGRLAAVIAAGEALPPALADRWSAATILFNAYGPTENSICSTVKRVVPGERPVRIGAPIRNATVHILDRFALPLSTGEIGEIWVGGVGVARGYLGRDDLTAERFVADPFAPEPGARLYRTGDLGRRLGDGDIEFLGRTDTQVKLRGNRIELAEIENVFAANSAVAQAVALVRGESLEAFVVPAPGAQLDERRLRALAAQRLPDYMRPVRYHLIAGVPLSPNGKADRAALAAMSLPQPDARAGAADAMSPAASFDAERVLARLWSRFLQRSAIEPDDDFFALGGDSIVSTRIANAARGEGLAITARDIFEAPTIAALAARVSRPAAPVAATEPARADGAAPPLTPIQRWFFALPMADRAHWNLALQLKVGLSFDLDRLAQAYLKIAASHDALRARFRRKGRAWCWESAAQPQQPLLRRADLDGLGRKQGEALAQRLVAEMQQQFDLKTGRLVGFCHLASRSKHRNRLIIVAHHLVMDGVSWGSCSTRSIVHIGGEPVAPATGLADWARALAGRAETLANADAVALWNALPEARGAALPFDDPDASDDEATSAEVSLAFDATETETLTRMLPSRLGVGVEDVLMAGLRSAMAAWSGSAAPVVVNVELHGRDAAGGVLDAGGTIGWFTTYYPLALSTGDPVAVAAARRALPAQGRDFLLLRHGGDRSLSQSLAAREGAISFNYLGRLGGFETGSIFWGMFRFDLGQLRDPRARRPNALAIDAAILDGRLAITIGFGSRRFKRDTVLRLANAYRDALAALAKGQDHPSQPGAQEESFPLTPVQRGMALHGGDGVT